MSPRRARRLPDETPRRGHAGGARRLGVAGTSAAARTTIRTNGLASADSSRGRTWDWVVRLVPGAASVKESLPGM